MKVCQSPIWFFDDLITSKLYVVVGVIIFNLIVFHGH